jgi:hypothetical protein
MSRSLLDAAELTDAQLRRLSGKERARLRDEWAAWVQQDARAHALEYYRPVNAEAGKVHASVSREIGVQGGNKSGKTATMLAEAAIQMTGVVPRSLPDYPRRKLHPPIRVRLVVTSLTSAWDVNLKLKLQHWEWSGRPNGDDLVGDPDYGHWGFIPPSHLVHGDWMQSWSERHRVLTLTNGSTLQVMAHEQSLQDFNQGAFDLIVEDEIPPEDVHRANRLRVMERGGQLLTGGTPSDDRANVAAGWFFDQVLAPGLERGDPGDPEVFAVALWTEQNRTLDPANIDFVAKGLTPEQRRARLHGEAIHLGGLIFPGFQERPAEWCFRCGARVRLRGGVCPEDGGTDVTGYSHVWDAGDLPDGPPRDWPILFYLDPHQARETACLWVAVDPSDGWWALAELEVGGDARAVKAAVEGLEAERGWTVLARTGDPKITAQTNQFAREFRGEAFTIRRAFEDVGFYFDDANTNFTVARDRVLQAFQPNPYTRAPRLRVHESCRKLRYQLGHFVWLDRARREPTATKEQPSRAHSDFPALLRYLAMDDPTYAGCQRLRHGAPLRLGAGVGRGVTGW